MATDVVSRTIPDLSDEELIEGYHSVEDQISAEYKILSSLRGTKDEYLQEIFKRFEN